MRSSPMQVRNVYFGVREHAMGAAANGMAQHGGVKPFVSTFFVFNDYLRPSIRLAALQKLPVTYVFTHDSIAVGEDGPTHEPVEQLTALRAIPGLTVIRPSDANETASAWAYALQNTEGPVALILSRQNLPVFEETKANIDNLSKGAYVLTETNENPDVILMATGSEVSLAVQQKLNLKKMMYRYVLWRCQAGNCSIINSENIRNLFFHLQYKIVCLSKWGFPSDGIVMLDLKGK